MNKCCRCNRNDAAATNSEVCTPCYRTARRWWTTNSLDVRRWMHTQWTGPIRCAYCLTDIGNTYRCVDHIVPLICTAQNARWNLTWCCRGCNARKYSSTDPAEWEVLIEYPWNDMSVSA